MDARTAPALPYFPVEADPAHWSMGTQALGDLPLIEIDPERYHAEIAEKAAILASDHRYYFQGPPGTEAAQWEVVETLLPHLAERYPRHFTLERRGGHLAWHNRLLGRATTFRPGDAATLPYPPLDWVSREVQEDLILMGDDAAAGFPLVAGQLCFASGWDLDEMLGRSFLSIHADVPRFDTEIGRSASLLMARLKVERPVWRANWSIKTTDRLNLAPRCRDLVAPSRAGITAENAGERCFFRVERQTLSRLARTRAVLFTIHTYVTPLAVVAADPGRARRLAHAIRHLGPHRYAYKNLAPLADALLDYLDRHAAG